MPVVRPPDQQATTIFRWPAPLTPNDSVVVGEEDACVSLQHGTVLGVFAPGTHQLPAVIPDGVELWFCATRVVAFEKLGGRVPGGGAVFGQYAYRVFTPHLVVAQLAAGGDPGQLSRMLNQTLMKALVAELGAHPAGTPIPDAVLDQTQAKISAQWAQMGVRFEGFMGVDVR